MIAKCHSQALCTHALCPQAASTPSRALSNRLFRHGLRLRRTRLLPSTPACNVAADTPHASAAGIDSAKDVLRVDLSAYPKAKFFRVEAIIRPWRLSDVVHELTAAGILGMTQTNVLGAGVQGGTRERYKGTEHGLHNLVEKSKLEIVCFRTQVDTVVQIICGSAKTGEIGDGKIFVSPVVDVIRIRTEETGATAERMEGGMSDQGDASDILGSMHT